MHKVYKEDLKRSESSTSAETFGHYARNIIMPKSVSFTVPFPSECENCHYEGFTQVEPRHTSQSVCIGASLCGMTFLCNPCYEKGWYDEYKTVNHYCYNCKQLIA